MRPLKLLNKYNILFICSFLLSVTLNAQDAGFFQQQKVSAINSQEDDLFGGQISMLGDTLVLASAKGYNNNIGAVSFLRENESGNWQEFFTIIGNPDNGTSFGSEVAIVEDFAFVAQSSSDNSGEVRVYQRGASSNSWNFLKVIKDSSPAASNFFGYEIIAKGDFLMVSDQKSNVFIYKKDEGGLNNWGLIKEITGQADADFGAAMDFDGETLVIGAPLHDGEFTNEGNAYVYELNGAQTDFDLVRDDLISINSRNTTDGNFGASVSIEGNRMLVASPGEKSLQGFSQRYEGGNCYVLDESSSGTNNWGYSGFIDIPIFEDEPGTISKVLLRNNNIFINFINRSLECQPSAGVIYWYKLDKGYLFDSFDFFQLLKQAAPSANAHFGSDYAFNGGNDLVVGSNAYFTTEKSVSGDLIFFGKQAFVSEPLKTFQTYDATYADLISPSSVQLNAVPEFTDFSEESGFVVSSTNPTPTLCDDVYILPSGATEFTLTVNDLEPATEYYFRPYNISSRGESYGLVEQFRTNPVDSRLIFEDLIDNYSGSSISTNSVVVGSNDEYIFAEVNAGGSKSIVSIENQVEGISVVQNLSFSAMGLKNSDNINSLEVSEDGNYLYAGISGLDKLISFSINSTTGALSVLETLSFNGNDYLGNTITGIENIVEIVSSNDNKHLYVLSRYSDDQSETYVSAFAINQTTGELEFIDKFITGENMASIYLLGQSMDIKPDGSEILVTTGAVESGDNGLISFSRNSTTGELTFVNAYQDFMLEGENVREPSFQIRYSKDGNRAYGIGTFGTLMVFNVNNTAIEVIQNITFSPQQASALAVGADEQVFVKIISNQYADRQLEAINVFEFDQESNKLEIYESKRDVIVDVYGEPQNIIESNKLITDNNSGFLYTSGQNSLNQFSTIAPGANDFSFGFESYYFEENEPEGTATGEFFSFNPENAFYELVSGEGDDDNEVFSIENGQLIINEVADYENKDSYSVRVKAETEEGETLEDVFVINVNNVNEAPTAINFSTSQIKSDYSGGLLGQLSAEDPDMLDDIRFYFIEGDNDNNDFIIEGNEVYTKEDFALDSREELELDVKAVDVFGDGLSISGSFKIDVIYLPDADGDGIPDSEDNCPNTFNPDQADKNDNGIGDVCDCEVLINPSAEVLCNDNSITLDAGNGFTSYNWSTGDTSRVITINSAGVYSVEAINEDNCLAIDSIKIETVENPTVNLGDDITSCLGDTITLDAGSGFQSYNWSTGESTRQIEVVNSGEYYVSVTSTQGCIESDTVQVNLDQTSEAELNSYGFILTASEGSDYQWYFDGELLADSTQSIIARRMGVYEVAVISETGCISYSEEVTVLVTAEKEIASMDTRIYPNPAKNEVSIFIPQKYDEEVDISVFSLSGELMKEISDYNSPTKIDISKWESGVYLILLRFESFEKTFKVIKK
ncbi:T9SS type A sorting domain-containing protein [Marivirga tractuosa]|uniref:T9SS type A sorting domain-containing protein n=1 Tax=Marivirga tractuosa TaxID=1006 RepID=UPI0035D05C56